MRKKAPLVVASTPDYRAVQLSNGDLVIERRETDAMDAERWSLVATLEVNNRVTLADSDDLMHDLGNAIRSFLCEWGQS